MEKYKDKEWLQHRYDRYPISDIADECGVASTTIIYWLKKLNVDDRLYNSDAIYDDIDWLKEKYLGEGLSTKEISELEECDVGRASIAMRLSYYGIREKSRNKIAKQSRAQGVNPDSKHLDAKWLREQYVEHEKTDQEIADMDCVYVSKSSVGRVRRSFGIDSDYHIKKDDSNGFQYGKHWDSITERIRKRDDYECQACGTRQREYLEMFDMKLDVHHKISVDEFDNIDKANADENLITLCRRCHRQVEVGNRKI